MSSELEEATSMIHEVLWPDDCEIVQLASKNPNARLYGAYLTVPLTIGYPPIVIADKRGIRYLEHGKLADAWAYASEHALEPPKRNQI